MPGLAPLKAAQAGPVSIVSRDVAAGADATAGHRHQH
jgi:hypothetical protein